MLTQIYTAIFERMVTNGTSAVMTKDISNVAEHDRWPKISFYPVRDRFEPVLLAGGSPKAVRDRISYTQVVLWGGTVDHVDQLIAQTVLAVHQTLKAVSNQPMGHAGLYEVTDSQWVTDTRDTNYGYIAQFTVGIRIPILVRTWVPSELPPTAPDDDYKDPTAVVNPVVSTVTDTQNEVVDSTVVITDSTP